MTPKTLLCTCVLMLACIADADDFILSYWCGPPESEDVRRRYAEVAECGFNYAMLPCSGATAQGNKAILDACKKNKLKYILFDSRIMALGPENPAFKTNLDAVVSAYSNHPALGGYFLTDEPGPGAFPQLAAINQHLLARDSVHLPFINLFPNYAPEWALGGTYEQHVEKFCTMVKPRLLCFDHYALMTDGSLRPNYFDNLEIIRRQAIKHNVPFGFIFQVTAHGGYRDPSEDELRWQANTALAYGARALLYFTYWTPTFDPLFKTSVAVIDAQGKRSHHYEPVKRVNHEIMAWAPILMKLKSTGIYHTSALPQSTQALPENSTVRIESTGAFIIGMFEHEDGSEWLMIVNRDMRNRASAVLHFVPQIRRLRELSTTKGRLSSVKLRNHDLPVTLPAGAAKLWKLSR